MLGAKNNAVTVLGANMTSSQTTMTVVNGSVFPAVPFVVTVENEIMTVTNVAGNTLTVTRGSESTTPATHTAGVSVENRWTAGMHAEIVAQLADFTTQQGLLTGLLTTAKTSLVAAINELFNNKANKVQEAWITPVLLNGATFPASVEGLKFRKNQFGELEFKGEITTVASGTQFNMPDGYYNTSKVKRNNLWVIGSNTRTTYQISTTGNFAIYGAGQYSLDGLVLPID